MINILIDRSGKTSKESIFLGNQHENLDETLHFIFPQEYKDYYKYITYSYSNNNKRVTGISPLVDDNFIVSSKITKISGVWELNLICKTSPVDLNDKVIDLTENNSSKEHIFISNTINACVSGNSIDVESFNNVAIDENIANLYDSILALKNIVEENDKVHEQNEAVRKANELERQEAENTRKANESERVSAEQLRVEAEEERKANEVKRQSNENARTTAETNRDTAEIERVNAENQRVEAEIARQSVEANRASAENNRASAEINRVDAENERVSAETLRKQFENFRHENEESRKHEETIRVETENLRVSAESERHKAEQSRISAESQRVTSEATRESEERARVEAENERENAEQLRVNAENLRVEAENRRDSVINDLKEDLDKKITKFYASNQGETHIIDSDSGKIQDMFIYGKSSQDGTPTIENPIEIKSIVNPTVKVFGANILRLNNLEESTFTKNGITFSSKNGVIKAKGTATADDTISTDSTGVNQLMNPIKLESGKTYIFSPNPIKGLESYDCYIDFTNSHNLGFSYQNSSVDTPKKITDEQAGYSFGINLVFKKGTEIDMEWKPQVLLNEKLIPYEPYKEQTVTLPITLNAVPVSSGGNITVDGNQYIADYIDVERGKIVRMTNTIYPKIANDLSKLAGVKDKVINFRTNAEGSDKKEVISNMLINTKIWEGDIVGTEINVYGTVDFTLPYTLLGIDKSATHEQRNTAINEWLKNNDLIFVYILKTPTEEDLTSEQVQALKALKTYYPTTNISVNSEQLNGYTVFNYPISMENGWNFVKQQLNDNRDYIYDIDMQSAEAYVNSEYVTALTELGGIGMLYKTLLKLKERDGLTNELKNKIDIFFATGRITEEQYNELMDIEEETKGGK